MHIDQMIEILNGTQTAPSSLTKVSVAVARTAAADRALLVEAIRQCIRAHEEAGRVVAGGLFVPYADSFARGLVGVHVFAVGRAPDDPLRHCYVSAELPDIGVSEAIPSQGYPRDHYLAFGIMLDVSEALTRHVGSGRSGAKAADADEGPSAASRPPRKKAATK